VTSRSNGQNFTDDSDGKHEVSNLHVDKQYVLVNLIKTRCHDSDDSLSSFIPCKLMNFNLAMDYHDNRRFSTDYPVKLFDPGHDLNI
jgi:hypothetical protein